MEYMKETVTRVGDFRQFENENYTSTRDYFENGVVDGGYNAIQFDFSECSFDNEDFGEEIDEVWDIHLLSEDEEVLELIEE